MDSMKWIKLTTSLFEDDKLLLLERLENGHQLQLFWIKLLCLAGKHCPDGVLRLSETKPYTPARLSTVLRMEKPLVKRGLELFCDYGMVSVRDGFYVITNWERHQSGDAYQRKLRYDREYQAAKRAEAKKEKTSSFLELAHEIF